MNELRLCFNRRRFLECFSAGGLALMPGALMAVAQDSPRITLEMLQAAEKIAGVSFTNDERQAILARLRTARLYVSTISAGRNFRGREPMSVDRLKLVYRRTGS